MDISDLSLILKKNVATDYVLNQFGFPNSAARLYTDKKLIEIRWYYYLYKNKKGKKGDEVLTFTIFFDEKNRFKFYLLGDHLQILSE